MSRVILKIILLKIEDTYYSVALIKFSIIKKSK